MDDRVDIQLREGIADVQLARADKINALDIPMFEALVAAAHSIGARDDVRVAMISGRGRGFSVGIDLNAISDPGNFSQLEARTHGVANLYQAAVWSWRELRVPIIAAVHGFALGGGFQLMLGADIRIVAPSTKLSAMEIKYGLVPDMAAIALLRSLVRDDIARELIYTGRNFDGLEAERLGLATRLSPEPRADALALAATIAQASPLAIAAAKRLLNGASDESWTAARILQAEAAEQTALLASVEHRQALQSSKP